MAIVEYKCDTCKRLIEKPRNTRGLEVIGRCTITKGCRGNLYQIRVLQDFQRGTTPPLVDGLDDWVQRKVLHNHTQLIRQSEWVIKHDMGSAPQVSVFSDGIEITPTDIITINENVTKLVFAENTSGVAQLVGRQSDPNILTPIKRPDVEVLEDIQMSSRGEVNIAVLASKDITNVQHTLQLTYTTHTSEAVESIHPIVPQTINSAWGDVQRIVLFGKIYDVRSFIGITPDMVNNVIGNGSSFVFNHLRINGEELDIEPRDFLLLLSDSPFAKADKVFNKVIDVTSVSDTNNQFGFYYSDGELYAQQSTTQVIYPRIRSV